MLAVLIAACAAPAATPVRIIFDTDMGNDIDDALALAMIHALESRGEIKLLAVTITKDHINAARYIELVNRFYGRDSIPIGIVKDGKTPQDSPMLSKPLSLANYKPSDKYEEAASLLRRVLQKERDRSVVLVQVGFFTNAARLLDTAGGPALVAKKVKSLVMMAGEFPAGPAEFNVRIDIPAAKRVFADWPTPIVTSGFEIGKAILYPARAIDTYFRYAERHPVADSYRAYKSMPYDRPTWDLTAVLHAARPSANYFTLSKAGVIAVDDKGVTTHTASAGGKHRYLILEPSASKRVLDDLISLSSRPPDRLQGVPNKQYEP